MDLTLQLSLLLIVIEGTLAAWQQMQVMRGRTLTLRCPIRNANNSNVEWKDPKGFVMFFNHIRALRDKRYSIYNLSNAEFTVSVSDVDFRDGGNYTCSHYGHKEVTKIVEVTVLEQPRMKVVKHGGQTVVKCWAAGNHHCPQILWRLDNGLEVIGHPTVTNESAERKCQSEDLLRVKPLKRVKIECIVHHPALFAEQPLHNFVFVGRSLPTHVTSPTVWPGGLSTGRRSTRGLNTGDLTGQPSTATRWQHIEDTAYILTTKSQQPSSTAGSTTMLAGSSTEQVTVSSFTGSHSSTTYEPHQSESGPTRTPPDMNGNRSSTTGWSPVTEATEDTFSHNDTRGNSSHGGSTELGMQGGNRSSPVLVFLVSCLIFALLVVVIFFIVKLRKAHVLWIRENEDSPPSTESNKSKSSSEEKQGHRKAGLCAFTKYVTEEPCKINPAAMTSSQDISHEQPHKTQEQPHKTPAGPSAQMNMKETEL